MKIRHLCLLAAVLFSLIAVISGCGSEPTSGDGAATVAPAPSPVPSPAPLPTVIVTAPPPFCPFDTYSNFAITEKSAGVFHFSWDVVKTDGKFLDRFQIQVYRNGREFTLLEAQVGKLGGPHDRTYIYEWKFPGLDPGSIAGKIRVHYPNDCRDDDNGNVRANGPWSDIVASKN